jgi:integrase
MASATIVKRRDRFHIRITGRRGEGEQWLPAHAHRSEAERELVAVRAQLARADEGPSVPDGSVAFGVAAERWFARYAGLHVTKNTLRSYRSDLDAVKEWFGTSTPIGHITTPLIAEFVFAMHEAGAAPQTTRHHVNRVMQVLKFAVEQGDLATAPSRPKLPKVKRVRPPLPLRPNELAALLAEAVQPWRSLFAMAALHGLRTGEARGLRWGDIRRGRLYVARTLDSVNELHEPKTGSRSLPVDPVALAILAELPRGDADEAIFPEVRSDTHEAHLELRATLKRAGVARAVEREMYDLRHTYACFQISQDVQPVPLAKWMGNSVPVLMSTYAVYWEDLSPQGELVASGMLSPTAVGEGSAANIPDEWKSPANGERETGLEPATLSLEG